MFDLAVMKRMNEAAAPQRFCLVSDDSAHKYVIPVARQEEWYDIEDGDQELPEWATRVSGGLTFTDPQAG